jgi:hypothetical protein
MYEVNINCVLLHIHGDVLELHMPLSTYASTYVDSPL